jgi:hypothetical protein
MQYSVDARPGMRASGVGQLGATRLEPASLTCPGSKPKMAPLWRTPTPSSDNRHPLKYG